VPSFVAGSRAVQTSDLETRNVVRVCLVVSLAVTSWRTWTVGTEKRSHYWEDGLMSSRYPSSSCLRIELSVLQQSPRAAQDSASSPSPLPTRYDFRSEPSSLDSHLLGATDVALRCCRNRPDSSINVKYRFKMTGIWRHQGVDNPGRLLCFKLEET
jgi:hypothetical protein